MANDFAGLVGIDLGTTFSCIARLRPDGTPETIPNREGERITPSVIYLEEELIIVGREAKRAGSLAPERTAFCVKRDMGLPEFSHPVAGRLQRPEVLSALVLKRLKADAEERFGKVTNAVITVPAYFDDVRRKATQDAGRLADLNVLDIINEPTAAALAYAFDVNLRVSGDASTFLDELSRKELTVLVYDLGGGTFDVSLVKMSADMFVTLATDGDVQLGGYDWDSRLADYFAEEFFKKHGSDPRADLESRALLFQMAEEAKQALAIRPSTRVLIVHDGQKLPLAVTRDQFSELTADLLTRTETTTELLVESAGLTWNDVDRVLLVGGMTRVPQVRDMLRRISGKEPDASLSADEAVAHGAAIHGGILLTKKGPRPIESQPGIQRTWANFKTVDVNAHSLGIAVRDGERYMNSILIPKNSQLPVSKSEIYRTHAANQRKVRVRVLEGEARDADACQQIGVFDVEGLPPQLPAGSPIEVSCSYGTDGRITVVGKDVTSGNIGQTVITRVGDMKESEITEQTQMLGSLAVS